MSFKICCNFYPNNFLVLCCQGKLYDQTSETYNRNSQIQFKTTILKSRWSYYSDAYIFIKGAITRGPLVADAAVREADEWKKEVIIKNCALFADCISKVNSTQENNATDLNVVMPVYNVIKQQ